MFKRKCGIPQRWRKLRVCISAIAVDTPQNGKAKNLTIILTIPETYEQLKEGETGISPLGVCMGRGEFFYRLAEKRE